MPKLGVQKMTPSCRDEGGGGEVAEGKSGGEGEEEGPRKPSKNFKNYLKTGPEPPQKQARIKSKSIQKVRQEMSSNGQNLGEL